MGGRVRTAGRVSACALFMLAALAVGQRTLGEELMPLYNSSFNTDGPYTNRWQAEQDIFNAAGWPGSERAVPTRYEVTSVSPHRTRTTYRVQPEYVPKHPSFRPLFYGSADAMIYRPCYDCPVSDQFGINRCAGTVTPGGLQDTGRCIRYGDVTAAIHAHYEALKVCHHEIVGVTPWRFGAYANGPGLEDGTQTYRIAHEQFVEVAYYGATNGVCDPSRAATSWHKVSSLSVNGCPTGYYDAASADPQTGASSCSNHFRALLYEYNPVEFEDSCPVGNPCYPRSGAKSLRENDFESPSLEFTRSWNSFARYPDYAGMGRGWTHNYSQRLLEWPGPGPRAWKYLDGGGAVDHFYCTDEPLCDTYRSARKPGWVLRPAAAGGWRILLPNGESRWFDTQGRLVRVERVAGDYLRVSVSYDPLGRIERVHDVSGRSLVFNYNADGLVDSVTLPSREHILFDYERPLGVPAHVGWRQRLVKVTRQDLSERRYHYEDQDEAGTARFEFLVTGITDENGQRLARYAYDAHARVVSSEQAGGVGRIELEYTARPGESERWTITRVRQPLGGELTYEMESGPFRKLVATSDAHGALRFEFDAATGWRARRTDRIGGATLYEYADGLHQTRRVEAAGTDAQRVVETDWDPQTNRVAEHRQAGRINAYTYNERGQVLSHSVSDAATGEQRKWTYTYLEIPGNPALLGKLSSVDGPRLDVDDVTHYEYYTTDDVGGRFRAGDLRYMINALGQVTEYLAYDLNGRPARFRSPDGRITTLEYHARGWVSRIDINGRASAYEYDAAGNRVAIRRPDGSSIRFEYDAAHRLVARQDALGNRVEYTLDAAGNRVSERSYDASGRLHHRLDRDFDEYGSLRRRIDGNGDSTEFGRDSEGRLTTVQGPGGRLVSYRYDALGRRVAAVDAARNEARVGYDRLDRPVAIGDPLGNTTFTAFDGLGNRQFLDSPDSGWSWFEHDAAGNLVAATDGAGNLANYRSDALNRLLSIDHAGVTSDVAFHYDQDAGRGRLTGVVDATGESQYRFDGWGRLSEQVRTIDGSRYRVAYEWDEGDRIAAIQYPSGMQIVYSRDAIGRIRSIHRAEDGHSEDLVVDVNYLGSGPVVAFAYGNGLAFGAGFDLEHQIQSMQSGPLRLDFTHDPAGDITGITEVLSEARSWTLRYDELGRLVHAFDGAGRERAWKYDANGNREMQLTPLDEVRYSYQTGTNRLTAFSGWQIGRDSAGNRIEMLDASGSGWLFSYTAASRLQAVTHRETMMIGNGEKKARMIDSSVGDYGYDGLGRRIVKTSGAGTTHFIYGRQNELLGEYRPDGTPIAEYVWMRGVPVAVVAGDGIEHSPMTSVVDNGDTSTQAIGDWSTKTDKKSYGTNHQLSASTESRYRWYPQLTAGAYEVHAWWVSSNSYSDAVEYRVDHQGGSDRLIRSHRHGGGRWQRLGTWVFSGGADEFIEASADDGIFSADAVRFEPMSPHPGTSRAVHYVHADHQGAPRAVTSAAGTVIWLWDRDSFGRDFADEDPDGDGVAFNLNLRLPGQYFDRESGLHYNLYRDYDPNLGRYVQSDPIGLRGGMNPYSYASSSPWSLADPDGLAYFAFRPLEGLNGPRTCVSGNLNDILNIQPSHEQLFFEDGEQPDNLGLFSDSRVRPDKPELLHLYDCRSETYNDCVMRKAASITEGGAYCMVGLFGIKNNCQDWADRVRTNYRMLLSDPAVREECLGCQD